MCLESAHTTTFVGCWTRHTENSCIRFFFFLVWVWTWALCCWKWTMFIVWHLFVVGGLIYELHLLKPPILFLHECTLASTALRGSLGFIYPQFILKTNASQHRDFYCGPVVILFCFCLGVCFLPNHSDLSCGFVKACILACMLFYYNGGGGYLILGICCRMLDLLYLRVSRPFQKTL